MQIPDINNTAASFIAFTREKKFEIRRLFILEDSMAWNMEAT